MTTTKTPPAEPTVASRVAKMAAGIANAIRTKGHYQGVGETGHLDGACIVANSPYFSDDYERGPRGDVVREALLGKIIEIAEVPLRTDCGNYPKARVVTWNDTTPTEQVLEVLDKIASGEA